MPLQEKSTKGSTRFKTQEPPKYFVLFHNDDFTPMEFVVVLLESIFFKTAAEATDLMLKVHKEGQAVVGSYSYDIAASKVRAAESMARAEGFPLRLSLMPE